MELHTIHRVSNTFCGLFKIDTMCAGWMHLPQAVFVYCCLDCPKCPAQLNSTDKETWVILVELNKYSINFPLHEESVISDKCFVERGL